MRTTSPSSPAALIRNAYKGISEGEVSLLVLCMRFSQTDNAKRRRNLMQQIMHLVLQKAQEDPKMEAVAIPALLTATDMRKVEKVIDELDIDEETKDSIWCAAVDEAMDGIMIGSLETFSVVPQAVTEHYRAMNEDGFQIIMDALNQEASA